MDVNTTDPYEQKLYHMFKSFDLQSMGTLDKTALMDLCTTLELKDRSTKLVANLIDPKRNNRVSFNEFKEGLLNLLGTDTDDNDDSSAQGKMTLPKFYQYFDSINGIFLNAFRFVDVFRIFTFNSVRSVRRFLIS